NGTMMTTLPSESLSTESLSTEPLLSTSSSDTKQTCDETTVQVESETQIPTELSNFQELISPAFRISKVSTKILKAKDGVIYTVPDFLLSSAIKQRPFCLPAYSCNHFNPNLC
ncbi:MAG: hypothetical protein PHT33_11565, partial [bacterium]|nr:hypothetical protein [bacterium]